MDNVQDLCSKLMKPPRELASWNFPLSQILDEYFNLLPEPCKISFGEAAFIIQNSVNAYVRRVEELYDETKCFSEKIIVEEEQDKNNQKERKLKKNLIDLSQFESISFSKEIGKNINLKNHDQKPIKFLHQCFSQLENSHAKLNVKVYDIQGEIIGKKYDFRCNQPMNKNGTLVEEFTLKDFENIIDHLCPEKLNGEVTDNFQSPIIPNFFPLDSVNLSIEDSSNNEAENKKSPESDETEYQGHDIVLYDHSTDEEIMTESQTEEDSCVTDSSVIDHQEMNNESLNNEQNDTNSSLSESDPRNTEEMQVDPIDKKNEKQSQSIDTPVKESKPELKRSNRLKRKLEEKLEAKDPNLMQPIPFSTGIPEKLEKSRKEFKLPCHIALLKSVPRKPLRSRKCTEKKKRLSKKQANETQEIATENLNQKCLMYSPSGPFLNTKEENPNNFRRNLSKSFEIYPNFTVQYQPITTLNMDLLGFAPNQTKIDPQMIPSEDEPDSPSDFRILSPPCVSPSPSSLGNHDTSDLLFSEENLEPFISPKKELQTPIKESNNKTRTNRKSCQKYDELVKCKIEEIYKELDLQTDEDQKVARWHEEIKPRLQEAERKPPFCIHDYESKIKNKLKTSHKKLSFDDIVREEPACEIARYFSATLQLASTNNLNINSSKNPQKSIELILLD